MASTSSLLVMGLAGTGKTTFLAALWHVAESEEIDGSLRLVRISDEAGHLNELKDDWQLFKPAVRSILAPSSPVSILLKDAGNSLEGEVIFPDPFGETFRDQWKERQWTTDYERLVQVSGSILFFVKPDRVVEPYTIAEIQRVAEAAFPEEVAEEAAKPEVAQADREAVPLTSVADKWTPELAPTQVQVVGLLQFLEPYYASRRPVRLAIIISAWDQVIGPGDKSHMAPQEWVQDRLPYLDQYLRCQCELFDVQVYGVSAQGGDLKQDMERLKSIEPASRRIIIEGPHCAEHDITEPVRWALGWRH